MRTRDQLAALYDEWQRLTDDERASIRQSAWARVDECQSAKHDLQTRIIDVSERLQSEWESSPGQRREEEPHFRHLVEGLIQLENRNSEQIAVRRREAEQQKKSMDKASRSLREIQRLYGGPRGASWNSYS